MAVVSAGVLVVLGTPLSPVVGPKTVAPECGALLSNTDYDGNDLPASEGGMGNNTAKTAGAFGRYSGVVARTVVRRIVDGGIGGWMDGVRI